MTSEHAARSDGMNMEATDDLPRYEHAHPIEDFIPRVVLWRVPLFGPKPLDTELAVYRHRFLTFDFARPKASA